MAYLPIEDYGLIGNMHTAALVGRNGSIDWLCLPALRLAQRLRRDPRRPKGRPLPHRADRRDGVTRKQIYWPETNVLITRFLLGDGVVEVIDYMPVGVQARRAGVPAARPPGRGDPRLGPDAASSAARRSTTPATRTRST